jgi:hypothetical protein
MRLCCICLPDCLVRWVAMMHDCLWRRCCHARAQPSAVRATVLQVFWNQKADKITIDLPLLIDSAFCAGASMVTFGAVIGKVTPSQFLWLTLAQVRGHHCTLMVVPSSVFEDRQVHTCTVPVAHVRPGEQSSLRMVVLISICQGRLVTA